VDAVAWAQAVRAQDRRALTRLLRDVDDRLPTALAALDALCADAGHAFVVGLTGAPGAGKSTLADALIAAFRARGQRVAVVAVDPSSPLSGGALLGDRIRMQRHALDPRVFIRSLASRGGAGGISRSARDVVVVLDAAGFDLIVLETVGTGQAEVAVASAADVTVVVTAPGLGDGVQALKSGLLEVADVLVVNKADQPGADRTVADLQTMLALREIGRKDVAVIEVVATTGRGVDDLVARLEAERDRHAPTPREAPSARMLARTEAHLREHILGGLNALAEDGARAEGGLPALAREILEGRQTLASAAARVLGRVSRS
jgi:LAO/AO transport system kinase